MQVSIEPFVARVSNLLCRRLPVGRVFAVRDASGLEIRDTADWKSALRPRRRSAYEISGVAEIIHRMKDHAAMACATETDSATLSAPVPAELAPTTL